MKGEELERFRKRQQSSRNRKHREQVKLDKKLAKARTTGRWVSIPRVPTHSEKILARALNRAGIPFRSNCWIEHMYNVDFLISGRLIVEVEGSAHDGWWEKDQKREDRLVRAGFAVLRLSNAQVREDLEGIMKTIKEKLDLLTS